MTIKTITFQQTFPTGMYMNQRLGVEMEITDVDYAACNDQEDVVVKVAFDTAKKLINDAFHAMNPGVINDNDLTQPNPMYSFSPTIPTIDRGRETLKEIIKDCATLEELNKHWDNAVKYGLQEHFYYVEDNLKKLKGES